MDPRKTGEIIRRLRTEAGLTQQQLADRLHVGAKAVSKWETGAGCPDTDLLPPLAAAFCVPVESLLNGNLETTAPVQAQMRKMKFYVCPHCGNLVLSTKETGVTCCGRSLAPLVPQSPPPGEELQAEWVENEYFVTGSHPMEKDHALTFVALLSGDTLLLRKLWPEWEVQVRFPRLPGGILLWHCSRHGLFYRPLPPAGKK